MAVDAFLMPAKGGFGVIRISLAYLRRTPDIPVGRAARPPGRSRQERRGHSGIIRSQPSSAGRRPGLRSAAIAVRDWVCPRRTHEISLTMVSQ